MADHAGQAKPAGSGCQCGQTGKQSQLSQKGELQFPACSHPLESRSGIQGRQDREKPHQTQRIGKKDKIPAKANTEPRPPAGTTVRPERRTAESPSTGPALNIQVVVRL